MFPNPVSETTKELNLQNLNDRNIEVINVYDAKMGLKLFELEANKETRVLDISKIKEGEYLFEIISEGLIERKRIIIKR